MMQALFTIFRNFVLNLVMQTKQTNYFLIPQSSSYFTDIAYRFQQLFPGSYNGNPI